VRAVASRLRGADEIEARLRDASCIRDSVVLELQLGAHAPELVERQPGRIR
jgi:hypothetical protein